MSGYLGIPPRIHVVDSGIRIARGTKVKPVYITEYCTLCGAVRVYPVYVTPSLWLFGYYDNAAMHIWDSACMVHR